MNFIMQLPVVSLIHDANFVVVDHLSKLAMFVPSHTTTTWEEVSKLFLDKRILVNGLPCDNVSHHDVKFFG